MALIPVDPSRSESMHIVFLRSSALSRPRTSTQAVPNMRRLLPIRPLPLNS